MKAENGFEHHAVDALGRLAASMRELIQAAPGRTRRPTDLEKTLGIRPKLAWQVHRVAHADEPITEVGNVPGRAAIARFLEAAAKRGIPSQYITAVQRTHQEFQKVVKFHASSRDAFDSMASAIAANGSEQLDLQYKRLAFKSATYLWGIQAKAQLSCYIHWPSADVPDMMDVISLRGLIGLRRFRRNVSWVVSRSRIADDDGVVRHKSVRQPIDYDPDDPHQIGLLRKFCTHPLPKFRITPGERGFINISVEGETVGNQSAMTCLFADSWRAAWPMYRCEGNQYHVHGSIIRTPAEVLVRDVIFHEAANVDPATRVVQIYGDHRATTLEIGGREHDCLPLREEIVYLGKGADALATPHVPNYPEMFQYVLDRMGWDASKLHIFRLIMDYPIMPSTVVTQFDAAEPPSR